MLESGANNSKDLKNYPDVYSKTFQIIFRIEEDLIEIYDANHQLQTSFRLSEGEHVMSMDLSFTQTESTQSIYPRSSH